MRRFMDRRMRLEIAQTLVHEVVDRARTYNADERNPLEIEALYLFGGCARGAAFVGDVDIAILSKRRDWFNRETNQKAHDDWIYRNAPNSLTKIKTLGYANIHMRKHLRQLHPRIYFEQMKEADLNELTGPKILIYQP